MAKFYKRGDKGAVQKIADDAAGEAQRRGVIVSVGSGGSIRVQLNGSSNTVSATLLRDMRLQAGDRVILERSPQTSGWIIIGPYGSGSVGGNAVTASSNDDPQGNIRGVVAPSDLVGISFPASILIVWTVPASKPGLSFELEVADDADGTGSVIYTVSGSAYMLQPGDFTEKFFRVRSLGANWSRSGWTAWASQTSGGATDGFDGHSVVEIDEHTAITGLWIGLDADGHPEVLYSDGSTDNWRELVASSHLSWYYIDSQVMSLDTDGNVEIYDGTFTVNGQVYTHDWPIVGVEYLELDEIAAPDPAVSDRQRIYIDSTTHHLTRENSSGDIVDLELPDTPAPSVTRYDTLFYYTSILPLVIHSPELGEVITDVSIIITTEFDGDLPSPSIGTDADNALVPASFLLFRSALYESQVELHLATTDDIKLYADFTGSTVGEGRIIIYSQKP